MPFIRLNTSLLNIDVTAKKLEFIRMHTLYFKWNQKKIVQNDEKWSKKNESSIKEKEIDMIVIKLLAIRVCGKHFQFEALNKISILRWLCKSLAVLQLFFFAAYTTAKHTNNRICVSSEASNDFIVLPYLCIQMSLMAYLYRFIRTLYDLDC